MKTIWLVSVFLLLTASAFAQFGSHDVLYVGSAPSGSCVAGSRIQQLTTGAGTTYSCQSIVAGVGTWTAISGGGGGGNVSTGQTNVYTGGFLQDFSAATMELPEGAGFVTTVDSTVGFDTTTQILHFWGPGAADSFNVVTSSTSTTATQPIFATATAGLYAPRAIAGTDLPAVAVQTGQTNVYTAGLQDFTSATMEIPEGAGFTTNVNSTIGLDTTANITHLWTNNADSSICAATATDTTTTHAMFATAVAGICNTRAIATGDLPTSGISNVAYLNAGNTFTAAGTLNLTSASATAGLIVPIAAGAAPIANGAISFNSTSSAYVGGAGGVSTYNFALAALSGTSTTCTNQFFTVISAAAAPTCTTPTAAMVTNAVSTIAANSGNSAMTLDMSASTGANSFRVESKSGATATSNGSIDYDSGPGLMHLATSAVDATAVTSPASISQTSQTAAISTATLCTAAQCPRVNGQYEVHWDFWGSGTACSSVTSGSVTFLLTWTDANAVTHSAVALQMMGQTGASTTAMGGTFPFQTALANESASGVFSFTTNGTIIQYATGYTACTTGTGTYNLTATVERKQ
jgi:hypothetical protein